MDLSLDNLILFLREEFVSFYHNQNPEFDVHVSLFYSAVDLFFFFFNQSMSYMLKVNSFLSEKNV